MRTQSGAAAHVGRLGALAVALGVCAAVGTGQGLAWADTSDSGSSSPSSSSSTNSSTTNSSPANSSAADSGVESTQPAGSSDSTAGGTASTGPDSSESPRSGVTTTSGGALTSAQVSNERSDAEPDEDEAGLEELGVKEADTPIPSDPEIPATEPTPEGADPQEAEAVTQNNPPTLSVDDGSAKVTQSRTKKPAVTHDAAPLISARATTAAIQPNPAAAVSDLVEKTVDQTTASRTAVVIAVRDDAGATAASAATSVVPVARLIAAPQPEPPLVSAVRTVSRVISDVLAAVVAPFVTNSPLAPLQPSALWAVLAWARRELGLEATSVANAATAQPGTITTAAVVDPPPSSLDSTPIGWVTGQLNPPFPPLGWPQTNNTMGFNIYGTDLGIIWENGLTGNIQIAFGDTFSGPNMTGDWRSNVLLLSQDTNLSNGLTLLQTGPAFQFIPRVPGALFLSGLIPFLSPEVTIIPTSAASVLNEQYVSYMSVRQWGVPGSWTTNYSAISQYNQATDKWVVQSSTIRSAGWFRSSTPYVPGSQNFQQMAYVLQPEDQVAEGETRYLYAFGTPSGRQGSAYLSRVAETSVTDLSKYEYWNGTAWVANNPAVAAPILGESTSSTGLFGWLVDLANDPNFFGGWFAGLVGPKTGGNVSEMSVQYNEYLGKYVVLYGNGNNDVVLRTADTPEGPWSDPTIIATSVEYPGLYAPMIHPWSGTGKLKKNDGTPDENHLYWNMSLWGNYNVVLMQTDLTPLLA